MTDERMALVELLQKSGDGDFLRSVAEAVLQILMEADVEGLIGAGRHERTGRSAQLPQRLSRAQPRHAPGLASAAHPQAAPGVVLPAVPRAAQDRREGAGHGDPGGLDRRRLDPAGRRAGTGDGALRHLEEPSLQAVQGHRRAGQRLPRPADRGRMAVSLARRHLPQGPRRRPHRLGGGNNRYGRRYRRPARDRRPGPWSLGGRAVLVGLLEEPGQAWPPRRQAGDLGCP